MPWSSGLELVIVRMWFGYLSPISLMPYIYIYIARAPDIYIYIYICRSVCRPNGRLDWNCLAPRVIYIYGSGTLVLFRSHPYIGSPNPMYTVRGLN